MKTTTHFIVGLGEIGKSLFEVLRDKYPVFGQDINLSLSANDGVEKTDVDFLHICIRHSGDFNKIVLGYVKKTKPQYIVVHSTVPVGTTKSLGLDNAVHSPNRGLHPNLAESMRTFVKHIGGPKAHVVAECFENIGMKTKCHSRTDTTEAMHLCCNVWYGINIMVADEQWRFCRKYGLDYHEVVTEYAQTHNEGYRKLGHESKIHPIIYPPMGNHIKGHCIVQNALLVPEKDRGPMLNMLAHYNDEK